MEAGSATARGRLGWRLWAVVAPSSRCPLPSVPSSRAAPRSSTSSARTRRPRTSSTFAASSSRPGEIRITVRNPQPDELTIANVNVDDAIVPYTVDGPTTLGRLRSSTIVVPYEWVEEDPITVGVTSSTGIQTVKEIPAASRPRPRRPAASWATR